MTEDFNESEMAALDRFIAKGKAKQNKYPGVTLEEAEAVTALLGWDHEIREVSYIDIGAEMNAGQVNDYIFNLLGALFGEFEDGDNGKTWEDCPPMARDFYRRASAVEVR